MRSSGSRSSGTANWSASSAERTWFRRLPRAAAKLEIPLSDTTIRNKLLAHLNAQRWAHTGLLNVTVSDGVVDLWGISDSETERKAIRVAAETMAGVRAVNDHVIVRRMESLV